MEAGGRSVKLFVKLGGSFITDKNTPETLHPKNVVLAAKAIRAALEEARAAGKRMSLVLSHGAGSFGHIHAKRYDAVKGVHPQYGWEAFYRIRDSMARMSLLFLRHCNEGGLFPVALQPSAIAEADDGAVTRLDVRPVKALLGYGQIPVIHGDIIPDARRGFTIASTESLLKSMAQELRFDRIIMVSDTDGVLDGDGSTIPWIDPRAISQVLSFLRGSKSPDVTGGMRKKVECLYDLVSSGKAGSARIIGGVGNLDNLKAALLGTGGGGTIVGG
ncbi:MAG: hypothetical protein HZB91_04360 [Elusimicrobia bacterium]|nr:hypothetical protein [Elusimicrobiota bacterium]